MKKKSEFLSAFGTMFEILKALIQTLLDRGGTDDDLRRVQNDKDLRNRIVDLILARSALRFNPAEFIGKGWRIDPTDEQLPAAPSDIDSKDVIFKNMHRPGETVLNGEERLRRHREAGNLCFTVDHFLRFWNMRDQLPEKWKRTDEGETRYIYFDATVLRDPGGNRYTLFLCWLAGAWGWDYHWLGHDFYSQNQSAVAGK